MPHYRLIGAFSAWKSGHNLNNKLLRKLVATKSAWEIVTFTDEADAPVPYHQPAVAI